MGETPGIQVKSLFKSAQGDLLKESQRCGSASQVMGKLCICQRSFLMRLSRQKQISKKESSSHIQKMEAQLGALLHLSQHHQILVMRHLPAYFLVISPLSLPTPIKCK